LLQVVLNESGNTMYSGKELPSHKIKFNVTGMYVIYCKFSSPGIAPYRVWGFTG
jgi:hypothetical protein